MRAANGGRSVSTEKQCGNWTREDLKESARAQEFLQRAGEGDETIRPLARELVAEPGEPFAVKVRSGHEVVLDALIRHAAGQNVLNQEGLRHMAEELGGKLRLPESSPLEDLLIERIVVCWMDLNHIQTIVARETNPPPVGTADWRQERLDRAHRRYLSAIKALAQVRKLQIPAVQLNIADKQTNVLNVGASDAGGGEQ